jgi:hypothetical protein
MAQIATQKSKPFKPVSLKLKIDILMCRSMLIQYFYFSTKREHDPSTGIFRHNSTSLMLHEKKDIQGHWAKKIEITVV